MTKKIAKKTKKTDAVETAVAAEVVLVEPPPALVTDPEAVSEVPKMLSLTAVERLELRLYESEAVRYAAEARLQQVKRDAYLRQIDPKGELAKMEAEIRGTAERSNVSRKRYVDVVKAVEGRLKVKLAEYSFDDETGVLMPH